MDLKHRPKIPTVVTSMPGVMGDKPVVRGTRIPAMTIVRCLRGGMSRREIFQEYPGLPVDGIEVVERWARHEFGPHWLGATVAAE